LLLLGSFFAIRLRQDYKGFRDKTLPKLLKRSDIGTDDKKHLQILRDEKRWHPYAMRHTSFTKLAAAACKDIVFSGRSLASYFDVIRSISLHHLKGW
jgi:hypothetical protein